MKKFDLLLFETTSDTLERIFGCAFSKRIFGAAERFLSLKREEIGQNFDAFQLYLEKLLGQQQAMIIQSVTLTYLCRRLKEEYEEIDSYFSLLDKLYEAKFKLAASPCMEERPTCN